MRGALLLTAVLLATLLPSRDAAAQTVADCMEASPAEALSLCRALIEAGRDNADVWAQLTLSLDKSGRGEDAGDALAEALARYPRDADLLALRDRLAAKSSEEERLEQAGRRNRTAMAQGELKLLCRTRSGAVGIEACRRYLSMTDVDGERIRARLAELATDAPDRPDPEPATTAEAPPVAGTADREEGASTPAPVREPDPDPADRARRARIVSIQRALDALGLPVGTPDGIAGRRTREALARFDSLTGGRGSNLDDTTLAALEAERDRLDSADATLAASREAARAERFDEALELLARAESESALLSVPTDYRAQLERRRRTALDVAREGEEAEARRRAEAEVRQREEAEVRRRAEAETRQRDEAETRRRAEAEAEAVASSDAQRSASAGASAPDDALAALMTRIGTLERRIAEADARQRREQERLRERVQSAIGGL